MMTARDTHSEWTVKSLLGGIVDPSSGLSDDTVTDLCIDSRVAKPGDLFLAVASDTDSAKAHIQQAIKKGAVAVVTNAHPGDDTPSGIALFRTNAMPNVAGLIADRFYAQPSRQMRVIGVTGTNGKTSVSHYIAHGLKRYQPDTACGLLGTLGYGLFGDLRPDLLTTPDVLTVHRELAALRSAGAETVVMEVSSHALDQQRVAGVDFTLAVLTNLTRDHLDYHVDMAAYGASKRKLFTRAELRGVVVNADDQFGRSLIPTIPPGLPVYAYGLASPDISLETNPSITPVCGRVFAAHRYSLALGVHTPSAQADFSAPVLGRFNASNLLAGLAVLLACGVGLEEAARCLSDVPGVPGRMESFGGVGGQPLVVVDYSHTPDSLHTALEALRELPTERIWCVFGCGGDRDNGKRAQMAAAAAYWADELIITDDNPRTENADAIVADIEEGLPAGVDATVLRDRGQAIRHAISNASAHDTILIAGKGHEPYQEVNGVRRPFSDAAVVRIALRELRS